MTRHTLHDDEGSILPLLAGYVALALAIVLVVAAATSLYIERKRLLTLADGAALAGAESFELDSVIVNQDTVRPVLVDKTVLAAVTDYVGATPRDAFEDLRVENAATSDGRSATVTVSAQWRPPVLAPFVREGLRLEVTSTARTAFW
ncbi:putative membrane protein [Microbacteriaceae bacterium SG_E_30_P1]|uniref:Membrane protein n=1 Tax=Antiquaquibacter oligotrophicus TaxID=2880260 RepID=A0ABT6KKF2_9MICO|nr:pilus assembly protein TadG-related protein [Antiquaquibacter oligotrophicus]MDH6180479.1 putative membrane protein [Antiquaquibacter oligotrophicus]UDF13784.1 pilus assembly protein TadG-related protein [Antiquaquibacter oligotrophicus]